MVKRITYWKHASPPALASVLTALWLTACGGGSDDSKPALATSTAAPALSSTNSVPTTAQPPATGQIQPVQPVMPVVQAPIAAPTPVLNTEKFTVNTTTQGAQVLRSVGAVKEAGYTVAWLSGADKIFIQRLDGAGFKIGGEVQLQLDIKDVNAFQRADGISTGSVAVLRDGSVVVSYNATRKANPLAPNKLLFTTGIYVQRFDSTGAQVLPETEVFSRTYVDSFRPPKLGNIKTIALADGGFAIGWAAIQESSVTIRTSFLVRRYSGSDQAAGPEVMVGGLATPGTSSYDLMPDALGGYSVTTSQQLEDQRTTFLSLTYFDTSNAPQPIALSSDTSKALLLPLEGKRSVLFAQGSLGASRQFLDSLANPVGPQTPIPALPISALELTDGSYVTFTATAADVLAQRFDSQGVLKGESALIKTLGAPVAVVALPQNGFAAAWTGAGTETGSDGASDKDVFAQRFNF
jgi:hypothetical protein